MYPLRLLSSVTSRILYTMRPALYIPHGGSYRGVSCLSKQVFQGLLVSFLCLLAASRCAPGQRDIKRRAIRKYSLANMCWTYTMYPLCLLSLVPSQIACTMPLALYAGLR